MIEKKHDLPTNFKKMYKNYEDDLDNLKMSDNDFKYKNVFLFQLEAADSDKENYINSKFILDKIVNLTITINEVNDYLNNNKLLDNLINKDLMVLADTNGYKITIPLSEEALHYLANKTKWIEDEIIEEYTYVNNVFYEVYTHSPIFIYENKNNGQKIIFNKNIKLVNENSNEIYNISNPLLKQLAIISGKSKNVKEINNKDKQLISKMVNHNGEYYFTIPNNIKTKEMSKDAVRQYSRVMQAVPKEFITKELILESVKNDGSLHFIPKEYITDELKEEAKIYKKIFTQKQSEENIDINETNFKEEYLVLKWVKNGSIDFYKEQLTGLIPENKKIQDFNM